MVFVKIKPTMKYVNGMEVIVVVTIHSHISVISVNVIKVIIVLKAE